MKNLKLLLKIVAVLGVATLISGTAFAQSLSDLDNFAGQADNTAGAVGIRWVSIIAIAGIASVFMRSTRPFAKSVGAGAICISLFLTIVKTNAVPAITKGWNDIHKSTSASSLWKR